ncbi:hypothetical protein GEMRC1_008955 [Eukaryota sp. GEM-RC1]
MSSRKPSQHNNDSHKVDQSTKQFLKRTATALRDASITPEEVTSFVGSVLLEIRNQEVFLASNVLASPLLETIIAYTTPLQLRKFCAILLPRFDSIITSKAGSHFMESMFSYLYTLFSSDSVNADDTTPSISSLLLSFYSALLPRCRYYIRNRYAAHVIKSAGRLAHTVISPPSNLNQATRIQIGSRKPSPFHASFLSSL